jgi:hypothetical protein
MSIMAKATIATNTNMGRIRCIIIATTMLAATNPISMGQMRIFMAIMLTMKSTIITHIKRKVKRSGKTNAGEKIDVAAPFLLKMNQVGSPVL